MNYYSLSDYLKDQFGTKVYKLSLSASKTCPNRDGTVSYGGCIFCSNGGSGEFAQSDDSINQQIESAKKLVEKKFPKKINESERKYIAYFQSFTNTYGNESELKEKFLTAIKRDEIVALSIGTRPDSISDDMLNFLTDLNFYKPIWIELGLQTIHEKSAKFINRGYKLDCFEKMYLKLKSNNIKVIVHVIVGLPGESEQEILETIKYLSKLNPFLDGIKIQNLNILKGTPLEKYYQENPFRIFSLEEYSKLLGECLKLLNPQTVVHRITGDGAKNILIEPQWIGNKKKVLNYINNYLRDI